MAHVVPEKEEVATVYSFLIFSLFFFFFFFVLFAGLVWSGWGCGLGVYPFYTFSFFVSFSLDRENCWGKSKGGEGMSNDD